VPGHDSRQTLSAIIRILIITLCWLAGCRASRKESLQAEFTRADRLLREGDWKTARSLADSALRKCGSSPEWCWRWRILKAETLTTGQEADAALRLLDGTDALPQANLEARRRMDQGWAWFLLSDYARAEKFLSQAHTLAEASASGALVAEVEMRQGPLLVQRGRFDDAETTLRHGLDLAAHAGDPYIEANLTGNIGYLFLARFRYEEAIYWLQAAYDRFARLGSSNAAAQTIGNLGVCYYGLGDSEKALAAFEDATARYAKAGDLGNEQDWLGDSGAILQDGEDFPAAIQRYQRALEIATETKDQGGRAEWLIGLAKASISLGKLGAAEQYNWESLAINKNLNDRLKELYNQLNAAEIAAARKQFTVAEQLFLSTLNAPSEDPTPALQAQEDLAKLYIEIGQPRQAEAQFRSAIAAIERRQAGLTKEDYQISYLASLVRFYRSYVDFLVGRGDIAKALAVVESSRARLLRVRLDGPNQPQSLNASEIQAFARSSHRILVSYWLGPKQSYVWAITPAKIEMFTLPPEKNIRDLTERYRTIIEDLRDPVESRNPAGVRISEILLGPIRQLVPPGSHVVIVPDGALHSLNFATLPAPADTGKYWIEDVTLSVAPSLGLVLHSRPAARARPASLLAIGDPESPGQDFPRLPHARKEMDTIAALFSTSNKTVYEGAQSKPSVYRASSPARFSFIHFAAHATANRANPLDSALILSRERNVYSLSARDIMQIPLEATLVTLSSCRSAGARTYSGEGLVGLTWAFLQAGARNVIAGLWDVDDESTALLMSRMYAGLARGAPPEDALRAAQLSLLHAEYPYQKPYYWGPFQLYSRTEKRTAGDAVAR
jgi:CHAT domain-containing protein/Flp pilus assembly protein TadD